METEVYKFFSIPKTLDALCYALDCDITDIIKFVKE
ncbi:MAG: hypothetical protein E7514_00730 [Ruminococcaceae bacterium]|nr:hypothetical protein [Oscillospiraceae bacterium]